MASRLSRHDSYGKPLPRLAEPPRSDLADHETNVAQRDRILRQLGAMLDEHYPYLLRYDVSAEVTLTFKIQRGIMQGDIYVGILRHYRQGEE